VFYVVCFLSLAAAMTVLFALLGPSTLAGVAIIVALIPANYFIQRKSSQYQDNMMKVLFVNPVLETMRFSDVQVDTNYL
jgi:hypothetical protein